MLTSTCRCGLVRLEVPREPRRLTACNCSICRRYATLRACCKHAEVQVVAESTSMSSHSSGGKRLRFVRCNACGCVTHWEPVDVTDDSRVGVNARNFEPGTIDKVRVRRMDGASTWKFLD